MDQRTEEWYCARLGKVTASRIADVMAKTKSGYGASRKNYMAELVIERLTGKPTDGFSSAAMQWGTETEPYALEAYEIATGTIVEPVGFIDGIEPMTGASPDGLIGDDGLIEVKCPNSSTHIETLLSKTTPKKYVYQMQWQMACTDRVWCDFVSYDPRMPDNLKYFCKRVDRDQEQIDEIIAEVRIFLADLDSQVKQPV